MTDTDKILKQLSCSQSYFALRECEKSFQNSINKFWKLTSPTYNFVKRDLEYHQCLKRTRYHELFEKCREMDK